MSAKSSLPKTRIYQLKVTLLDLEPFIWRRLQVPGDMRLHNLHRVIQIAMGWTDSHLHQFTVGDQHYSIPSPDDWEPVIDERRFSLRQIAPAEGAAFIYEYDFGDSWEHEIVVEKIQAPEQGATYPVCLDGERGCPPEDIGGTWGYEAFLEAIRDPKHEEHESYLEWIGGEFDPEALNLDQINQGLRLISASR